MFKIFNNLKQDLIKNFLIFDYYSILKHQHSLKFLSCFNKLLE